MTEPTAKAIAYVRARLANNELTAEDVCRLVLSFQGVAGLEVDGIPGAKTLAELRPKMKVYPLPQLDDGRRPKITSAFKSKNPGRPKHNGCDLFYRWQESDGPVRLGDGGATRGPDGKPKWFIPSGVRAIAAAPGFVVKADNSPTGWRVWIRHNDGYDTGYFHLRNLLVSAGAAVPAGQPLGEVGDNPVDIDAEHLHFEVSPSDRYAPIDPEIWLADADYFTND